MNVNALIAKAVDLANSSKYDELAFLCNRILKKKPNCFDALQLLGLAKIEQGLIEESIIPLEGSCKLNGTHVGVRINLANSYFRSGRAEDSLKLGKEAVSLDAEKYESYLVLGNAYFLLKDYKNAEKSYLNVIRLNPKFVQAYDNLGESVKRQGRLEEAIILYFKANEISPSFTPIYAKLVNVLLYVDRREEALEVANIGLQVSGINDKERFDLWVGIARYGWLTGNIPLTVEALDNSLGVYQRGEEISDIKNLTAYHTYISSLSKTFDKSAPFYNQKYNKLLYFIAESHSLSASNVIVSYASDLCRIKSSLILGCKVWFLSRQVMNEFRASLAHMMARIPERANVVLGFGEIDCRANEGILPAYRDKDVDYKLATPTAIKSYIKYTLLLAEARQQKVLIYGVPAPSLFVLNELDCVTQVLLIDIVRFFNDILKKEAKKNRLSFIDVYRATVDSDGRSNMKYHIDAHHLHPSIYALLFDEYIVEPESYAEKSLLE